MVFMFFSCLHGFPAGALVSFQPLKDVQIWFGMGVVNSSRRQGAAETSAFTLTADYMKKNTPGKTQHGEVTNVICAPLNYSAHCY